MYYIFQLEVLNNAQDGVVCHYKMGHEAREASFLSYEKNTERKKGSTCFRPFPTKGEVGL